MIIIVVSILGIFSGTGICMMVNQIFKLIELRKTQKRAERFFTNLRFSETGKNLSKFYNKLIDKLGKQVDDM